MLFDWMSACRRVSVSCLFVSVSVCVSARVECPGMSGSEARIVVIFISLVTQDSWITVQHCLSVCLTHTESCKDP